MKARPGFTEKLVKSWTFRLSVPKAEREEEGGEKHGESLGLNGG